MSWGDADWQGDAEANPLDDLWAGRELARHPRARALSHARFPFSVLEIREAQGQLAHDILRMARYCIGTMAQQRALADLRARMQNDMETRERCPYCDGSLTMASATVGRADDPERLDADMVTTYHVACPGCGLRGPRAETPEEARRAYSSVTRST